MRCWSSGFVAVCKSCDARCVRWGVALRVRACETRIGTSVRAMRCDAIGNVFVTPRVRTSSSETCRQVFLHFFLNIIVQTNYDSP
ncbi:hypothetical protein DDK22_04525 [Cupriavidus necator]|uniref:Uncharacterized protein n=1 Tax=Cupriavidus necator TaxID=106590 RepID=A0A367PNX9_CUPNE|nr:hypothetical protein DDK22_04525 [Cupriavidus necator]